MMLRNVRHRNRLRRCCLDKEGIIYMEKKNDLIWSISLFTLNIVSIILVGSDFIGIEFPDIVVWIMIILDMITLSVMVYATVKKIKKN